MPVKSGSINISGKLNVSPRVQIRDIDQNLIESYQKYHLVRSPFKKPLFDDSQIFIFKSSEVMYPALIPSSSKIKSRYLSSPSFSTDLTASSRLTSGISDSFLKLTTSSLYRSFNDNNSFKSSSFYFSRINDFGADNFNTRASSLNVVEIDLGSSQDIEFGFDSNMSASNQTVFPMVYWNFNLKRWEKIGKGCVFNPSNADGIRDIINNGTIGFFPGEGAILSVSSSNIGNALNLSGRKISNFGFPFHPRYHATSSQCMTASNYLNNPFMVHKVEYVFSASFFIDKNTSAISIENKSNGMAVTSSAHSSISNFFMLRQREGVYENLTVSNDTHQRVIAGSGISYPKTVYSITSSNKDSVYLTPGNLQTIRSTRDCVFSLDLNHISTGSSSDILKFGSFDKSNSLINTECNSHDGYLIEGLSRDLNKKGKSGNLLDVNDNSTENRSFSSGVYHLSGNLKNQSEVSGSIPFSVIASGSYSAISNTKYNPGGKGDNHLYIDTRIMYDHSMGTRKSQDKFFFASIDSTAGTASNSARKIFKTENISKTSPYIIFPQDKLIFGWQSPIPSIISHLSGKNTKGSRIKILSGTSKVKLYGNFVRNEKPVIDDGNFYNSNFHIRDPIGLPVLDSFKNQRYVESSGSYYDYLITGSFTAGTRDVVSSIALGSDGTTLFRNPFKYFQCYGGGEIFLDSILPDITEYVSRSGMSVTGNLISASIDNIEERNNKRMASPYSTNARRITNQKQRLPGLEAGINTNKAIFGIGHKVVNTAGSATKYLHSKNGSTGNKYGILNIRPISPKAIFRYDRFGQMRDMMEQRPYSRMVKQGEKSRSPNYR